MHGLASASDVWYCHVDSGPLTVASGMAAAADVGGASDHGADMIVTPDGVRSTAGSPGVGSSTGCEDTPSPGVTGNRSTGSRAVEPIGRGQGERVASGPRRTLYAGPGRTLTRDLHALQIQTPDTLGDRSGPTVIPE